MKKIIFLGLLFLAMTSRASIWVYVPDANFRNYISGIAPGAIVGDSMDKTNAIVTSTTSVNISGLGIASIEGIEYFASLIKLDASNNQITSVNSLPNNILYNGGSIDLSHNLIDTLGNFPAPNYELLDVDTLNLSYNLLSGVFKVEPGYWMRSLNISHNQVDSINMYLYGIQYFDCSSNQISYLSWQTDYNSLLYFDCSYNRISNGDSIAPLISLRHLNCASNRLHSVPPLYIYSQYLNIDSNAIYSLGGLPASLVNLYCNADSLYQISSLPGNLQTLDCRNNYMLCLPELPNTLTSLQAAQNFMDCLPNKPAASGFTSDIAASSDTFLICGTGECYRQDTISGYAYIDLNDNGIKDAGEPPLANVPITLWPLPTSVITDSDGYYTIWGHPGISQEIAADSLPFTRHKPDSVIIYLPNPLQDTGTINFGFHYIDTFSDARVFATEVIRAIPGQGVEYALVLNNHGARTESGELIFIFNSNFTYASSLPAGTLSADTVKWNFSNLVPGESMDYTIKMTTNSNALLGTIFHDTAYVSIVNHDSFPANNIAVITDTIVGKYQRNNKTVSPPNYNGSNFAAGQYLDYNITFQNTDTSIVNHVWIIDTLSQYLDMSTLYVVGASAPYTLSINGNALRVDFYNINLPDSSANQVGSHGYFRFLIKPLQVNFSGQLQNTAYIYFNGKVTTVGTQNNVCLSALNISLRTSPEVFAPCIPPSRPGSAMVTVTSGTPGFSYVWGDGSYQPTDSGLAYGPVYVTVTDGCAFTAVGIGYVDSIQGIILDSIVLVQSTCSYTDNGSLSVYACSGTPIQYTWSDGETTPVISNISPGQYFNCTLTDATDTFVTQQIYVGILDSLYDSLQYYNCGYFNQYDNQGWAQIAPSGVPPFNVEWTDPFGDTYTGSDIFAFLQSGDYYLTVTDSLCTLYDQFQIQTIQIQEMYVSAPACNDNDLATLTYQIIGASNLQVEDINDNYYYIDFNQGSAYIQPNEDLIDIEASQLYENSNNPVCYYDTFVSTPAALDMYVTFQNSSPNPCVDNTDITAFPNSSSSFFNQDYDFSYSWSLNGSGQTGQTIISPPGAGIYTCTVTDVFGCTGTGSDTIAPCGGAPVIVGTTSTPASCLNSSNGSATVSATGITLQYIWSDGETTQTAVNLEGGQYAYCTVSNGSGQVVSPPIYVGVVDSLAANFQYFNCGYYSPGDNQGWAGVIPVGIAPFTVTWGDFSGLYFNTGDTITGLNTDYYFVAITDSLCSFDTSFQIQTIQIQEMYISAPACTDADNATLTYQINGASNLVIEDINNNYYYIQDFEETAPVQPNLNFLDIEASEFYSGTGSVCYYDTFISTPAALDLTLTFDNESSDPCSDPTNITASVYSASNSTFFFQDFNFNYSWNTGDQVASIVTPPGAGVYSCSVTDFYGCSATANDTIGPCGTSLAIDSITTTPATCPNSTNGSATVYASGSSLQYNWSDGETTQTAVSLQGGQYAYCTVSNGSGSVVSPPVYISIYDSLVDNLQYYNCGFFSQYDNLGWAQVSPAGVGSQLSVEWEGPSGQSSNDNTYINLTSGSYFVITADSLCSITDYFQINTIQLQYLYISAPACNDGDQGTLSFWFLNANGIQTEDINNNYYGINYPATVPVQAGASFTVEISNNQEVYGGACYYDTLISTPAPLDLYVTFQNITQTPCTDGTDMYAFPNSASSFFAQDNGFTYTWSTGATVQEIISPASGQVYTCTISDIYGCSGSGSDTIAPCGQPPVIDTITVMQPTCAFGNYGSATVYATGSSTLQYAWSDGENTQTAILLLPYNSYNCTVTDSTGSAVSANVYIEPQDSFSLTSLNYGNCGYTGNSADNTAWAVVYFSGQYSCTFQWSGSNTGYLSNGSTNFGGFGGNYNYVTGLPTDEYTVSATDDLGCTATVNGGGLSDYLTFDITIMDWQQLYVNPVIPCTNADSSAIIYLVSGAQDLQFENNTPFDISNVTTSSTYQVPTGSTINIQASAPGNEYVAVCYLDTALTTPNPVNLSVVFSAPGTVCGQGVFTLNSFVYANGQLLNTLADPVTYMWSTGETTASINDALPGVIYSCTVTDANHCVAIGIDTLAVNDSISISNQVITNVSCYGGNNGQITIDASSPSGISSYSWNNGQNQANATLLIAGEYSCSILDNAGCSTVAMFTVTQPDSLSISAQIVNAGCGSSTGNIQLVVTGGTGPYSYQWVNNESGSNDTLLVAGTYPCTVTDANSCSATGSYTVSQSDGTPVSVTLGAVQNVSCFGSGDGFVQAIVTGGTKPFLFQWNNNEQSATDTLLGPGIYSCTITDSGGCSAFLPAVQITQPAQINLYTVTGVSACGSSTIHLLQSDTGVSYQLQLNGTPFSAPLQGTGSSIEWDNETLAGTYTVSAYNGATCSLMMAGYINVYAIPGVYIQEEGAACQGNLQLCAITDAEDSVTNYLWSNNQTTACINYIPGDTYSLTITNVRGCTDTASIITDAGVVQISNVSIINVSCYDSSTGSVTLSVNGGVSPYQFSWSNHETTNPSINLAAGNYTVTVSDGGGCSITASYAITQPATALLVQLDSSGNNLHFGQSDTLTAIVAGGNAPYLDLWSNGDSGSEAIVYNCGDYAFTVTDGNGCAVSKTLILTGCSFDSVWPGDANYDGIANNLDLLPIGLAYGDTGVIRPNASLTWIGQYCPDWNNFQGGSAFEDSVNFKHIDCNGDGVVDANDTVAILLNYGLTHLRSGGTERSGYPPLIPHVLEDTVLNGDTLNVQFVLGDSTYPALNVYGLAFTLSYDHIVVDTTKTQVAFGNSWLGNSSDEISISKDFGGSGQLECAVTRINHTGSSGSGVIGTASFVITTDNINGKNYSYHLSEFYINNVVMLDNAGNVLPVSAAHDSTWVGFLPTSITGLSPADYGITLFPNPANGQVTISSQTDMKQVKITDVLGSNVPFNLVRPLSDGARLKTFDVSLLSSGIYVVEISTVRGVAVQRLAISR